MPPLALTPAALATCEAFIRRHGAKPIPTEHLEAVVAESLDSLFRLFEDELWHLAADTHSFGAIAAVAPGSGYHQLILHATRAPDDSWLVGTPEEFPVTPEYQRRRSESEAAIIRKLT